ncbi:hypothetical protein, partial [Xenorhabdus innexi]
MSDREEHDAMSIPNYNPPITPEEKVYPAYQARIKEVNQNEMLSALREIQATESSYWHEYIKETLFRTGHHSTFINTCNSIRRTFDSTYVTGGLANYRHFICSVANKTVGIIILMPAKPNSSECNIDQIAFIVTYPNGYGYGGLLVQHVVNISLV